MHQRALGLAHPLDRAGDLRRRSSAAARARSRLFAEENAMLFKHFVDAGALVHVAAQLGERHQPARELAEQGIAVPSPSAKIGELGADIGDAPVEHRVDRVEQLGIAQIGADRVERGAVGIARSIGRRVEIERELLDLARQDRAVAAGRARQPLRHVAGEAQAMLARHRRRQPRRVDALGHIAGECASARARRSPS
jgi:hypothetical protein